MFPVLLQVDQSPAKKPLLFLGNQDPIIDMKRGQSRALIAPANIMTTMK